MNSEDIIGALLFGCLVGLLIFGASFLSRRGRAGRSSPATSLPQTAIDRRYSTTAPVTPTKRISAGVIDSLLSIGHIYVLALRIVVVALFFYGAWVAPRIRWAGLGAVVTFAMFSSLWRYANRRRGHPAFARATKDDDGTRAHG